MTEMIKNKTFDESSVGETVSIARAFRAEDVETWAVVTGDLNLIDLDPSSVDSRRLRTAPDTRPGRRRCSRRSPARGYRGSSQITGAADIWFIRTVPIGMPLQFTVSVKEKRGDECIVVLDFGCTDDSGQELLVGTLEVTAPSHKMRFQLREMPTVQLRREECYLELIRACDGLPRRRSSRGVS